MCLRRYPFIVLVVFALASTGGCSRTAVLTSSTPATPVAIDASVNDWQDALHPVAKERGLSMGVRNDGQDLYVALVVTDEDRLRQLAIRGLTVWFDPGGKKEKHVGIQFPIGLIASQRPTPGERPVPGEQSEPRFGRVERGDIPTRAFDEFLLRYGADDPGERFLVSEATGLEVAASLDQGTFVYELRVPLHAETGFAIGADPGATIGLGLETPEIDRTDFQGPRVRQGGFPGGGSPPGGGGFPGGGGPPEGDVMIRSGGFQAPEPLKIWTTIHLAE